MPSSHSSTEPPLDVEAVTSDFRHCERSEAIQALLLCAAKQAIRNGSNLRVDLRLRHRPWIASSQAPRNDGVGYVNDFRKKISPVSSDSQLSHIGC